MANVSENFKKKTLRKILNKETHKTSFMKMDMNVLV